MGKAASYHAGTRLLQDETVMHDVSPHPFGMYRLYLVWVYFLILAALIMHGRGVMLAKLAPVFPDAATDSIYMASWALLMLLSGLFLAVMKISLRWLTFVVIVTGVSWYLKTLPEVTAHLAHPEDWVLVGFSVAGILVTDTHRRAHSYLVTTQRVVIRSRALLGGSERSLFFSRIDDLIVAQTLVGKLLGFGTIIPIGSSGIGTGTAEAATGVTVGARLIGANLGVGVAGLQGKKVPRESLEYTLYNVPDPHGTAHSILQEIAARA